MFAWGFCFGFLFSADGYFKNNFCTRCLARWILLQDGYSLTEVYLLQCCTLDYTFIPGGLNMGFTSETPTCPPRSAGTDLAVQESRQYELLVCLLCLSAAVSPRLYLKHYTKCSE